jgi:hypothetical protein
MYVAENNIRETYDLPDAFQSALRDGYIDWQYAGAWGQDTLVLTDKGRAEIGLPPESVSPLRQAPQALLSRLRK